MRLPDAFQTASFRLAGLYLLLFVLSAGILAALLFLQLRTTLENDARDQVLTEVNLLIFEYREDGVQELLEEIEERIEKSSTGNRLTYMVQNPSGRVIFDSVAPVQAPYGWRRIEGEQQALFYFKLLDNGYILGVGKDLVAQASVEAAISRAIAWFVLGALMLGALGGWFLSRRTLAQLQSINKTARMIGAGKLEQRIPLQNTRDEFDDLSRTLNDMFDRIEHLVLNVRQVSTGIAHDLRTPLARLRTRLETLRDSSSEASVEAINEAIREVDGILQTFASLLRLAELEVGSLKATFTLVDINSLARCVAEAYTPTSEDSGRELRFTATTNMRINGDKNLLQQLLANLVENSLQHGGPTCSVSVRLLRRKNSCVLQVADTGPGIPMEERERVVRPFQRLHDSKGTGLGLAMAVAIAQLHGGELVLLDNFPGLLCEVTLPLVD